VRQGEHQVVVGHRQDRLALLIAPGLRRPPLALGTVTVTAGVIPGLLVVTLITVQMYAAQCLGPAGADVGADLGLTGTQRVLLTVTGQELMHDALQIIFSVHDPPPGRQSGRCSYHHPGSSAPNGRNAK